MQRLPNGFILFNKYNVSRNKKIVKLKKQRRKNMKKLLSLLLVGAMSLAVLTGCGKGEEAPAADAPASDAPAAETGAENTSDEEVTLTFLHHMGEQGKQDGLVKLVEAFHEKYPNINVEIEFLSRDDFINQYKQRVSADNAPDLIN